MAQWPWRYRSRSKVMVRNTLSHGSDHLCLIWSESLQNCRRNRADTMRAGLSYGHMGGMRLRTNFAAESRVVTWSCGDRSVSKETCCVAYNLPGVWWITFSRSGRCGSFWQRGCGNFFAWFAGRTAPQCTPCDHSCWNVTNQKCNKPCGFRTNRTCDRTLMRVFCKLIIWSVSYISQYHIVCNICYNRPCYNRPHIILATIIS